MPLTLEDIAALSGTSRSTVSRVINGDHAVREATRERVMTVLQTLNFQPNLAARGLAAGHTRVLGLVIPMGVSTIFTDPFFPMLIQGVSSACNACDYSVMLWLAEPEYERRTISKIFYNGLLDGVIVASMLTDDPIIEALGDGRLPFVLIGRNPSREQTCYVDVDNTQSSRQAVLHLLRLGRRRVATITGPQNMIGGIDRLQGYQTALRERGLPVVPELVAEGDFTEMGGYIAMRQLLRARPDAVFAASDMMAIGALRALTEAGLRVPQDVSLVGFDDIPAAAHTAPPLTPVRQPTQRMGALAVETLIDRIENPTPEVCHLVLPAELMVRESCGTSLGLFH